MKADEFRENHSATFFHRELLTEPGIPYDERRRQMVAAARRYLDHHLERVRLKHQAGACGRTVVGALTSLYDTLLRNLYRSVCVDLPDCGRDSCILIALGGYGRGELNPRSDIDLMFYYPGRDRKSADTISERLLYLLWDLDLDVGHSVRTDKDCLEMAERDITARTALLDSRLLVGDRTPYRQYEQTVMEEVLGRNSQQFIREKLEENQRRLRKYGSSVYLLEPNIKEGEGGLRDLHTALWIAQVKFKARSLRDLIIKGVLSEREGAEFDAAFDYLWRIRNELHYLSSRKTDQINFLQQEKIAAFLGYRDNRTAPAVEQFMQGYYAHATAVEHMASMLIAKATQREEPGLGILGYLKRRAVDDDFYTLRGELRTTRSDLFAEDPAAMMEAFRLAQHHEVELAVSLKGQIRDNLHRVNDRVRRSRKMVQGFMEILRRPRGMGRILRDMHHLQFLNHFIPEFRRIFCKVQHDAYHIYTVDMHTIFAVEEIARLWLGEYRERKPLLTRVAAEVEKKELLLLAVLLHDIGKGEGKDHCNKGAAMVPTIARRLGLGRESSQRLEFLVRNHLQMAHISQRRDLHDDKLILQFARAMESSENLEMLYLLTFADIKAVGPDVWSEWKGLLLQELFEKAYDVLERGDFRLEKRSEKIRNRKRKIAGKLREEFEPRQVRDLLATLNTRYLMSYRASDIIEHLQVVLRRRNRTLALKVEQDTETDFTHVIISTLDVAGLFSRIAGVMAANGINILGAQIFTTSNGIALDILQVCSAAGERVEDREKWQRFEEELAAVLEGRSLVDELVSRRQRPSFLPEKPRPRYPDRVEIDNEVSDEYTVVDIYTRDREGLLYQVTNTLKELGLYIGVAKISTKVDQVTDTFYVQDIFGQKVLGPDKLSELRDTLLACLAEEGPADTNEPVS